MRRGNSFINEPSLQDQMSVSLPCFQKMCDEYELPPTYMEIVMMTTSGSCGHRTLYEKRVLQGDQSRIDGKDTHRKRKPLTYGMSLLGLFFSLVEFCDRK